MFKRTVLLMSILVVVYGCGDSGGGGSSDQDTTAPTVISTSPANNATNVAVNSNIKVTFSETMSSSSITDTSKFYVRTGGSNISGSISYGGTFATFLPMSSLSSFRGYTATVTTGVKDSNGNPLASSYSWGFVTESSSTSTASFARDVQPIFDSNCIVCHISLGQAAFLPLTDDVSYGNLVNEPSTYTSGGTLVIPGNSTDSILYKRISGTSAGAQMPKGVSALSSSDQNLIKTWIDEGALDN